MNHHFNAATRKTGWHSAASERDSSMRRLSQSASCFFIFCRKIASNAVRRENVLKTIQTFLLQSFTAVISDARLTGHWSASRTVPFSLSVQDFARFPFFFLLLRRGSDTFYLRVNTKKQQIFFKTYCFLALSRKSLPIFMRGRAATFSQVIQRPGFKK